MKNIILLLTTLCALVACAPTNTDTSNTVQTTHSDNHESTSQSGDLSGFVSKEELFDKFPDFKTKYVAAAINTKQLYQMNTIKEPAHLVIVFGTWCHDSQREIPKLLRALDMANNSNLTYQLVAVGTDKQLPADTGLSYTIQRTPTVIGVRNKEVGRVVETPKASWPIDLAAILATNN